MGNVRENMKLFVIGEMFWCISEWDLVSACDYIQCQFLSASMNWPVKPSGDFSNPTLSCMFGFCKNKTNKTKLKHKCSLLNDDN